MCWPMVQPSPEPKPREIGSLSYEAWDLYRGNEGKVRDANYNLSQQYFTLLVFFLILAFLLKLLFDERLQCSHFLMWFDIK